jgi:DNA-binding MarR family transcriptional regulator
MFNNQKTYFNQTELRLIGEVLSAKNQGKRLISTQIAKLIGVTRSAVSQIVNHLEARGVVKRVADDVDKKIAYIEIADGVLEQYGKDLNSCIDFVTDLIERFGEDRFNTMCDLFNEFVNLIEEKM